MNFTVEMRNTHNKRGKKKEKWGIFVKTFSDDANVLERYVSSDGETNCGNTCQRRFWLHLFRLLAVILSSLLLSLLLVLYTRWSKSLDLQQNRQIRCNLKFSHGSGLKTISGDIQRDWWLSSLIVVVAADNGYSCSMSFQ